MWDWLNETCFLVKIATKHKHERLKTSRTSYFKLPDSAETTSHRLYSSSSRSHRVLFVFVSRDPLSIVPQPISRCQGSYRGTVWPPAGTPLLQFLPAFALPHLLWKPLQLPAVPGEPQQRQSVWSGANEGVSVGPACWIRWFDRNFKQLGELGRTNLSVCVKLQFIILLL